MEPLGQMSGAQHFLPAASAVELAPSCIGSSFALDPASYTERWKLWYGQPSVSLSSRVSLAQTGEGTPAVSQDSGTAREEAAVE